MLGSHSRTRQLLLEELGVPEIVAVEERESGAARGARAVLRAPRGRGWPAGRGGRGGRRRRRRRDDVAVASFDPSSTTISSKSVNVWPRADPIAASMYGATLYAGMMMLTAGMEPPGATAAGAGSSSIAS